MVESTHMLMYRQLYTLCVSFGDGSWDTVDRSENREESDNAVYSVYIYTYLRQSTHNCQSKVLCAQTVECLSVMASRHCTRSEPQQLT